MNSNPPKLSLDQLKAAGRKAVLARGERAQFKALLRNGERDIFDAIADESYTKIGNGKYCRFNVGVRIQFRGLFLFYQSFYG